MEDRLKKLYGEIEELSDDIPAQLAKKILLYTQTLHLIGRYQAAAEFAYGKAYADRKRIWGEAIQNTEGTAKDKEAVAEVACYEARLAEVKAGAKRDEWKLAFESTTEIIQALKVQHKTLMQEYTNAS